MKPIARKNRATASQWRCSRSQGAFFVRSAGRAFEGSRWRAKSIFGLPLCLSAVLQPAPARAQSCLAWQLRNAATKPGERSFLVMAGGRCARAASHRLPGGSHRHFMGLAGRCLAGGRRGGGSVARRPAGARAESLRRAARGGEPILSVAPVDFNVSADFGWAAFVLSFPDPREH